MANGFKGSPQEWKRITEPLERLDAKIEAFGNEKGLPLQHKRMKKCVVVGKKGILSDVDLWPLSTQSGHVMIKVI